MSFSLQQLTPDERSARSLHYGLPPKVSGGFVRAWTVIRGVFAGLVFDGDRHISAVSLIAHKLQQLSGHQRGCE
jgi:hypothetical protein